MTHHEHPNITLVREGFEAFQRGDTGWMDQHLADDVVWHVGGNSKWSGAYHGKGNVLDFFARQTQATDGAPAVDIHDILGNDEHVVVLGTASARAPDGSSADWKYVNIFHIRDRKHAVVSLEVLPKGDRGLGNGGERRCRRPVPGQLAGLNRGPRSRIRR
jgi:uncharacterized protein